MSHELEMVNGQAMMAFRESAGKPWHRLGTPVGDDLTPAEMMKAASLDWEVESVPTFAPDWYRISPYWDQCLGSNLGQFCPRTYDRSRLESSPEQRRCSTFLLNSYLLVI